MKKFLIAGAIATMTLTGMTSCSNSSSADTTLNDSISTLLGSLQGSSMNLTYADLSEADRQSMEKDQILAGIKAIMMADTANHGYMQGLQIGMGMAQGMAQMEAQGIKVDRQKFYNAFVEAFKADSVNQTTIMELNGKIEPLMQRAQEIGMKEVKAKMEADRKAREESPEAKKNTEDGKKFVDEAKAKDKDIKTTASGLSYKMTKEGAGESPKATDVVKVKYTGKHINGEVFDTSNGEAIEFPVSGVVPGFGEALQLMKKGGTMTVYIPGNLAYGADGAGDKIGPMETLVFDIELVDFTPQGNN